jgi:hypothetical protein
MMHVYGSVQYVYGQACSLVPILSHSTLKIFYFYVSEFKNVLGLSRSELVLEGA